jgi:hypothetical protein
MGPQLAESRSRPLLQPQQRQGPGPEVGRNQGLYNGGNGRYTPVDLCVTFDAGGFPSGGSGARQQQQYVNPMMSAVPSFDGGQMASYAGEAFAMSAGRSTASAH